jgi:hypothetical protein
MDRFDTFSWRKKVPLFGLLLFFQLSLLPCLGQCQLDSGFHPSDPVVTKFPAIKQISENPILIHRNDANIPPIGIPRKNVSHNFDFLFCLVLLMFFGIIRQAHPIYVRNIFRSFGNAALSNRQLREQLRQNFIPGLLLDLLFCFSAAFFLYHASKYVRLDEWMQPYEPLTVITGMAACLGIVYIVRFLLLRMAGWVFQIPDVMSNYSFNIFLFNRILGIIFIPFTIFIAFGGGIWVQISFLLALMIAFIIYVFRFIRSRQVFSYFLQFSKFHFILYLCASEILPIAVLIKLISNRLG